MSAILSAEALNDFIAPSVACIKPVEQLPPPPPASELSVTHDDAATTPQTAAQISLTDCLACSGCVTSSEAVLVQLQSHAEVLDALSRHSQKRFVAFVSPQSRAALAAALGTSCHEAGNMVAHLLQSVGIRDVLDMNVFRRIELEFAASEVLAMGEGEGPKKPILASSCPGFICYLESTHPQLIPHLSSLKSPQAIAGTFVKSLLIAEGASLRPEDVYTISVMPCYDKKLEGARKELTAAAWHSPESSTRDVDCVITTRELFSLAEATGIDFLSLPKTPLPPPTVSDDPLIQRFLTPSSSPDLKNSPDEGTSGGLLSHVLTSVAAHRPGSTVTVKQGRNVDTIDYILAAPSHNTIKLSRCYGFRNIQNLVRRLKPPKPRARLPQFGSSGKAAHTRPPPKTASGGLDESLAYVEVMACPGGCTNGGGQIKWDDATVWTEQARWKPENQKELLKRVDEAYYSDDEDADVQMAGVEERNAGVSEVVERWNRITGVKVEALVRTTYRVVENDLGGRLTGEKALEAASRAGGGGW